MQNFDKQINQLEIVKKIFDWYSTGTYSYLSISKKLQDEFKVDIYKSKVEKRDTDDNSPDRSEYAFLLNSHFNKNTHAKKIKAHSRKPLLKNGF